MGRASQAVAQLSISDYSQLGSLMDYLRLAVPVLQVTQAPDVPSPVSKARSTC